MPAYKTWILFDSHSLGVLISYRSRVKVTPPEEKVSKSSITRGSTDCSLAGRRGVAQGPGDPETTSQGPPDPAEELKRHIACWHTAIARQLCGLPGYCS